MFRKAFYFLLFFSLCFLTGMPFSSPTSAQTGGCNNVLRGAAIIDYSSSYSDDFAPENLVDGDENRSWSSSEDDEQPFITFDLGGSFEIDRLQLNGYYQANDPAYEGDSVRNFRLEALSGEQWIIAFEGESPLIDRLVEYSFSSTVVTNQVKIVFLSNHGGSSFEAAELIVCGQRASASSGNNDDGGKTPKGKENPTNEPMLLIQGDLPENGEDRWTFDASQNQIVTIELQANTRGAYVGLFEADGDRLTYDEAYDDYVEHTYYAFAGPVRIPQSGTYTILVTNSIGPYTLQVNEGYFGQIVGTFAVGQSVQGNLAERGFDRWLLPLAAGQIVTVELQANTRGAYVSITDPDGDRLSYDEAYDEYINNTHYARIGSVRILTEGLHMIYVSNSIGPYTLQVTEGYFGYAVGTVAVGQTVQGNLQEYGFDRWLVTLSAGQTITVDLQANTRGAYLSLSEPDGDRASYDEAYDSSGSGYRATISNYRVLTTGVYMIYVSNNLGDYSVTVSSQ